MTPETLTSSYYRFKPNEGVIIIGATNFPEALDKYVLCLWVMQCPPFRFCTAVRLLCFCVCVRSALIRPGRFDMQVTVPKPDVKGRKEILNWYLKKIKVDPGELLVSVGISSFESNYFTHLLFHVHIEMRGRSFLCGGSSGQSAAHLHEGQRGRE